MAVVLHPGLDRRFFYLPYVTRNQKGIEVFKAAEKSSMLAMEKLRAKATQRQRIQKSDNQSCLALTIATTHTTSKISVFRI